MHESAAAGGACLNSRTIGDLEQLAAAENLQHARRFAAHRTGCGNSTCEENGATKRLNLRSSPFSDLPFVAEVAKIFALQEA